jgi:hypothetical protein
MNVDHLSGDLTVPSFGPRMVCTKCGMIGAEVRPNWRERVAFLPNAILLSGRDADGRASAPDAAPMRGPNIGTGTWSAIGAQDGPVVALPARHSEGAHTVLDDFVSR